MFVQGLKLIISLLGIFLFAPASQAAGHLVINEVQLAGDSGASDEYVEIYNPTGSGVDLFGWSLQYKSSAGTYWQKLEFPSAVIPPGGYYLIAHNKFSGGYVDLSHQNFGMASSGGNLYLVAGQDKLAMGYDEALVVDKVAWGSGNDPESQTASGAPVAGTSIGRTSGIDRDNNAADFTVQNSTPGSANISQQSDESVPEEQENSEEAPVEETDADNTDGQEAALEGESDVDEENLQPSTEETPEEKSHKITGNIIINELLPNPIGVDTQGEWIEIKSIDSETVDLTGWRIADLSRSYTFDSANLGDLLLDSGEFILIKRSHSSIALNNTGGETVSLFNNSNKTVDSVAYGEGIEEGLTWARSQSGFAWTMNPTPGWENIIESPPVYSQDFSDEDLDLTEIEISDNNDVLNSELHDEQDQKDSETLKSVQSGDIISAIDYSQLVISELIPDPVGDDESGEWIELHNKSYQDIDLKGVMLGDNSGKVFQLPEVSIEAGGYLVISREDSKIILNNDGDEVKLWSPEGNYLTATRYFGSAVEGEAYALSAAGLWDWTTQPTPGEDNIFSQILGVESGGDELAINRPYGSAKRSIKPNFLNNSSPDELAPTIEDVRGKPVGTPVTVRGIVVAEPGLFAKTYFYIADRRHGIRIYYSKGEFPRLSRGDFIEVSGEISTSNDELRVKISSPEDISLIASDGEPEAQEVELSEIGEQLEGSLVAVSGDITSIKSNNIYLDDYESEARVYVADGTDIDPSIYQVEDAIQVTGIVSQTNAGFRVMPRDQNDFRLLNSEVAGAAIEPVLVQHRGSNNPLLVYLVPLMIIAIGGSLFFLNRRYHWIDFGKKQNPDD